MKLGLIAAAGVSLIAAAPALATSVVINATSEGTPVATGSFSYDTGDNGVLGYSDLTAFSLTVEGVTYTLDQVKGFTDYVQFAYDTATNTLESNPNTCGFAGCGFESVLSAVNSSGTSGYFFNSPGGEYAEYSTSTSGTYDMLTLTSNATSAVPEPVTWAMMIGGFGLVGGMMRRFQRNSEESFTRKVRALATA